MEKLLVREISIGRATRLTTRIAVGAAWRNRTPRAARSGRLGVGGVVRETTSEDRDVVVAASAVRELDQRERQLAVPGRRDDPLELAGLDVVRHPVAAQDHAVAGLDRDRRGVDLDLALEPDRSRDHVAELGALG